ncbi:MAG TPA: GNAT family N-acetyltransferase [Pyrinomonadaceae bacterium]|nr:GNAT family N-acetyltransferase [Pyrinomonadaceae bacterium]
MNSPLEIYRYLPENKSEWDRFVRGSRNGTFLFLRDYMDYHADRFPDFSLMVRQENGALFAVLPATLKDTTLSSHAGLTYGGFVYDEQMKTSSMLNLFDCLKSFLRQHEVTRVVYKPVPHIYHRIPSEEDLYGLFRNGAVVTRRDVSSTIQLKNRLAFSKGRRYALKQAERNGLNVESSTDFKSFMDLESETLEANHNIQPVHSGEEMTLLATRFPDNIKLHLAYHDSEIVAGVITYETARVAHAQYIAANDRGKQMGALDRIINHLIESYGTAKEYFDFGISTENNGTFLNAGLMANKESFGARAIVYDSYELEISSS